MKNKKERMAAGMFQPLFVPLSVTNSSICGMVQSMRGIILNDMYNIGHNMKQVLLIPILWAVIFLQESGGAGGYIVMCAFMFSMMIRTVIAYDEKCNWTKYAMILPVSRRSYVLAKYVDTFIFSAAGCVIATIFTAVSNQAAGRQMGEAFWVYCIVGISISVAYGSLCIPFLMKYGAEKARIIMIVIAGIIMSIIYGISDVVEKGGLYISTQMLEKSLWFLPAGVLILVLVTAVFSILIFEKREF